MKLRTLLFCLKEEEILLAMKKEGFGAGKWNGFGGKLEPGEDIFVGTVRETKEESTLIVKKEDILQVAHVHFYFAGKHKIECYVFTTRKWEGEPQETREMRPQWFKISKIPYDEMWAADRVWVPKIIDGKKIKARVYFNESGNKMESIQMEETVFS